MAIRVTRHVQACPKPPTYFEYRRGIVYDEHTFPPAPPWLQQQAVSEGWAVLEVAPEPPRDRLLELAEAFGFAAGDPVETEQGTGPFVPSIAVTLRIDASALEEALDKAADAMAEVFNAAEAMATLPPNSYIADGQAGEVTIRPYVQTVGPESWELLPVELFGRVTDLEGNPIPVGPDGLIHGEPLRGLTEEERAALPELLPQDAPAGEMAYAQGTSEYQWPAEIVENGEVVFGLVPPPLATGDSHPIAGEAPAPKPAEPPAAKPPTKPSKSRKRGR